MQPVDLADAARRPRRYWNADGLPELVMGLLWMSWGIAWLVGDALPRGRAFTLYWTLTPALLALSGVAAVWLTKRLKARLTFPRTGFVEWREPTRVERLTAAGVAMVTAAVLVGIVTRGGSSADHAAPVLGVILALAFVVAGVRQRAPHYLALAGVAVAAAIAMAALGAGWGSVNWMFVVIGAASVAVGAARLAIFMRKHPLVGAQA
jgi:hypothetical protein